MKLIFRFKKSSKSDAGKDWGQKEKGAAEDKMIR